MNENDKLKARLSKRVDTWYEENDSLLLDVDTVEDARADIEALAKEYGVKVKVFMCNSVFTRKTLDLPKLRQTIIDAYDKKFHLWSLRDSLDEVLKHIVEVADPSACDLEGDLRGYRYVAEGKVQTLEIRIASLEKLRRRESMKENNAAPETAQFQIVLYNGGKVMSKWDSNDQTFNKNGSLYGLAAAKKDLAELKEKKRFSADVINRLEIIRWDNVA